MHNLPVITGSDATGGLREYGIIIEGTWEQEIQKLVSWNALQMRIFSHEILISLGTGFRYLRQYAVGHHFFQRVSPLLQRQFDPTPATARFVDDQLRLPAYPDPFVQNIGVPAHLQSIVESLRKYVVDQTMVSEGLDY